METTDKITKRILNQPNDATIGAFKNVFYGDIKAALDEERSRGDAIEAMFVHVENELAAIRTKCVQVLKPISECRGAGCGHCCHYKAAALLAEIENEPETIGTKLAREIRAKCNNLSPEERKNLLASGMRKIKGEKHE